MKPHLKQQWCVATFDAEYLARMEELLELYAAEEPPQQESVWCFDERPCVLQDDVIAPLPMKPGSPKREDYTYERNGSAALLMAYNIHTGERFTEIRAHRTAVC